jgi:ATP-dependent Lhr-like helicase
VAAELVVDYLRAGQAALGGVLPTHDAIVFERFFDQTGGMQLIVHAPLGARINRALGLALRKKFCLTFDFELQAAASNDAVLLSLGPQHSFPLEDVPGFLRSHTVQDAVTQAVIRSPMFTARWRWDLNRSLAVLRWKGGRLNPFNIQRMEAADLMAAVFPSLAACQDNSPAGPVEIPDHLLVRETLGDCLNEAMDIDGLKALVGRFERGTVALHFVDTVEPSVLAHEILNGAPFTYLDEDTEIGERRSRTVPLRRGLPVEPRELGALDPAAIERVRAEAAPDVRVPDELHDVLLSLVAVRPRREWAEHFDALSRDGRCFEVRDVVSDGVLWGAVERKRELVALYPTASFVPDHPLPPGLDVASESADTDGAAVTLVQGHLDIWGPVTATELAAATGAPVSSVSIALESLRARGFAVSGRFEPERGEQWCARRLLARIHGYTRERRRAAVRPISQEEWEVFLAAWSHVTPGTQLHGRAGLAEVIEQLQGFEWPAGDWERVFAERVESYRPEWLDDLCLSGQVAWGRLSLLEPAVEGEGSATERRDSGKTPSRRTPITFMLRQDLPWLLAAHRGRAVPAEPTGGPGREVLDALRTRGALFHADLQTATARLPTEIEQGVWDGVARGLITADGFDAIRSLLSARARFARRQRPYSGPGPRRSRGSWRRAAEGRWTLLPEAQPFEDRDELAEIVAWQLLLRWGVVFRDVYLKERLAVPWREILWALRRFEARDLVRGGHFVGGVSGEQFAAETTVALLRPRRGRAATRETLPRGPAWLAPLDRPHAMHAAGAAGAGVASGEGRE